VTRFLLDANLSPKVGKFLTNELNLDIVTLHGLGLSRLKDHDIICMARQQRQVIITLDRDFAEYFYRTELPAIGIIYLDLPITHRYIPVINHVLQNFFTTHADKIDLERCLVIVTDTSVQIKHPSGDQ